MEAYNCSLCHAKNYFSTRTEFSKFNFGSGSPRNTKHGLIKIKFPASHSYYRFDSFVLYFDAVGHNASNVMFITTEYALYTV